jgi:hypothetical protein
LRARATSSGCESPYQGWSIGNHITSCGFTSATVKNHGSARSRVGAHHDAAFDAMIGSKCAPVPAQPMKWRSLPSQSAKPYAVMSGDTGLRAVPLADVARPVAGVAQDRADGRDAGIELGVLGHDHVVDDAVLRDVATGEQRRA